MEIKHPKPKTYSAYERPQLCQHQTCERRAQFHIPGADAVALRSVTPSETYPANLGAYKNKPGCSSAALCPAACAFLATNLAMHAGISSCSPASKACGFCMEQIPLFYFFSLAQPVPGLRKSMGTGLAWFGFAGTGVYSWLPGPKHPLAESCCFFGHALCPGMTPRR